MDLAEKIGQMCQIDVAGEALSEELKARLSGGEVGSIINQVDVALVNEIQRIAVEESRLGIPLLIGRDVIHGFKTVLPIPIGQAASWNGDLVEAGARISALEAAGPASIGPSLRCSTLPETRDGEGSLRVSVRIRVWHRCSGRPWSVDFRDSRSGTTDPLRPVPSILPDTAQQKAGGTTPRPIFPKMSCAMYICSRFMLP